RKSSFFVNPASCEMLFRRISTSRLTPAAFSFVKKLSADLFVNPIVNIFTPRLSSSQHLQDVRRSPSHRRSDCPEVYRRQLLHPLANGTYWRPANSVAATNAVAQSSDLLADHRHEYAAR